MTANPSTNGNNGRKHSVPGSTTCYVRRGVQGRSGSSAQRISIQAGPEWQSEGRQAQGAINFVDLKALFESALNAKVTLKQGESEQIVTMVAAGIEQLVNQFAKGDRHARRDVSMYADKLGVDLIASASTSQPGSARAKSPGNPRRLCQATERHDTAARAVFAPPELLDDDAEDQNRK